MDERLCVRRCLFDMMRSESLKEFPRFEYVFEISTTMRKMREGIKEEGVYILVHMWYMTAIRLLVRRLSKIATKSLYWTEQ